ncbi:ABC transporter substrate-binding protein [Pontibacillus sp. ALD_SL1]|uniref:ABC transporter substrate-binding protein n=1 Tax=Pontibacillus sp. ALD_SL1 TaxID=2777185 RepID=UPI001A95ECB2|nr:ABC transporter substrate-binding protein [Pontibacillus sp. ALD_SL1]QST01039.1 ABC transporter substrate-binding protein [Pontibacillus sp. ALD_SL1]
MKKGIQLKMMAILAILTLALVACGQSEGTSSEGEQKEEKEATSQEADQSGEDQEEQESEETSQTITYLGEEYTVPSPVESIATASLESMEDAAVLGVKPMATITFGGKIPDYVADELEGAKDIGSKRQPSYEKLLELKPDVILGTSKFQPEVVENLNKVAPMFPVSHISTDWEDNLTLMGQLTGKEDQAKEVISQYKEDAKALQGDVKDAVEGKKVMMVRIRRGSIFVYPEDVYFNPVLYNDLGIDVPEDLKAVKAQEMMTLEKLADINPDYLYVQFAETENPDSPEYLDELQNNAIWKSMNASKNNQVFVNAIDPMAQGGTAWSKTNFLDVVEDTLTK